MRTAAAAAAEAAAAAATKVKRSVKINGVAASSPRLRWCFLCWVMIVFVFPFLGKLETGKDGNKYKKEIVDGRRGRTRRECVGNFVYI